MKNKCKRWYGYKHEWRKCWYSEYVGHRTEIDSMLYGTKKCNKCGIIAQGFAEKENLSVYL